MFKVLSLLQKNLVWAIPISMTIELVFGYFFDAGPLKQFIIPVTFIMVYPIMATLNVKSIFKGEDYKLQTATQLINFVLIPIIAYFIGRLFFQRGDAIAMVYGVVMRDLSIALAIAMKAFGKQGFTIALLIALAYVIQIQSAAWYVKLVDWIFGSIVKNDKSNISHEPLSALALN